MTALCVWKRLIPLLPLVWGGSIQSGDIPVTCDVLYARSNVLKGLLGPNRKKSIIEIINISSLIEEAHPSYKA